MMLYAIFIKRLRYYIVQISYSARELFGPMYSRFKNAVVANSDSKKMVSIDEISLHAESEDNLLAELELRYKDECIAVRSQWKQARHKTEALQRIKEEQLWLQATLECDKSFSTSAKVMGLLERMKLAEQKIK